MPESEKFLNNFVKADNNLQTLNELCTFTLPENVRLTSDELAAELLLGLPDPNNDDRQFDSVVSLPLGDITVSIEKLMKLLDPKVKVYRTGASLFEKTLKNPDLLSGTPLEAAYFWTLSCRSFLGEEIKFGNESVFSIKCESLEPQRLFPKDDSSIYDLTFLKYNTM